MQKHHNWGLITAGFAAGTVAGLLGGGGGMVLIPLLTLLTTVPEDTLFPTSVSIMLPVCVTCLAVTSVNGTIPWKDALPYLLGSAAGGTAAGIWGSRIPVAWLHRILGILILWGGFRYLWQTV